MLSTFNGFYKTNEIYVDAVMINPSEYDLNEKYIWFDVEITKKVKDTIDVFGEEFHFYLIDRNKKFHNHISQMDSTFIKDNKSLRFFVAFEFKTEFLYDVPTFCFYCNEYNKVELID